MNKTKWIIFTVVVVAIFGGIIWASKSNQTSFTGDANKVINEGIGDHVKGNKDAKVVIIEYGDFQCPGCASMYEPIKSLVAEKGDKVALIFRNFPLTNIHPNALAAATAAEAAGLQGKFFEMHDILYENQSAWKDITLGKREETFVSYAKMLGLDEGKFKNDLKSKEVSDKIARDRSTGNNTFKVDSTPSFVVNGVKVEGKDNVSIEAITKKVNDAIAKEYPGETNTTQPITPTNEQQ